MVYLHYTSAGAGAYMFGAVENGASEEASMNGACTTPGTSDYISIGKF